MAYTAKRKTPVKNLAPVVLGEPIVTKETFNNNIVNALNWYNSNWEEDDYRKSAETYVRSINAEQYLFAINKAPFVKIRSIGAIGRIIVNGHYMADDYRDRLAARLVALGKEYVKPVENVATNVIAVRIVETANTHLAEFEESIDQYILNSTPFSAKEYFAKNGVSGVVSKKIGDYYKKLVDELNEAVAGTCDQLKQGYKNFSKKRLKQYRDFIQQIVDDCQQRIVSAKVAAKPRVKKMKPPSVVVRKLAYKRDCEVLKLKSIDPAKIVGSSELWVFDTKSRKLTVFYGSDGFLTIKSMAVVNYDVIKSASKKIRKPEEFFAAMASHGKRALTTAFAKIKGKITKPGGRMNSDTILLAVN